MEEPSDAFLSEWVAKLMAEDEHARYEAADKIARIGRPVLPRAMALVDDPRPRVRAMAAYLLAHIGDLDPTGRYAEKLYPDGVPLLVRLLESDSEAEVRAAAAAALGHHRAPEALPALCRAASDASSEVRFDVAFALGSYYDEIWLSEAASPQRETVVATLLRLMDDEDEDVRDWATFGVRTGGHDTPAVRARLWRGLDDPHLDVRGEAAVGLAAFGDRTLIPRLELLLQDDASLSHYLFEAAETMGDPVLLPAVLRAAQVWEESLDAGRELPLPIISAIEALRKAATGAMGAEASADETGSAAESLADAEDPLFSPFDAG